MKAAVVEKKNRLIPFFEKPIKGLSIQQNQFENLWRKEKKRLFFFKNFKKVFLNATILFALTQPF